MSSRETSKHVSISHVDALSITHAVNFAVAKFLKLLNRVWFIREQVAASAVVFLYCYRPVVDSIVNPMLRNSEFLGELRGGEVAIELTRMRLVIHS